MGRPEIVVNDFARSGDCSSAGSRTSRFQRCLAVSAVTLFMMPLHYSARIRPFRVGIHASRAAGCGRAVDAMIVADRIEPSAWDEMPGAGTVGTGTARARGCGGARHDVDTPECRAFGTLARRIAYCVTHTA